MSARAYNFGGRFDAADWWQLFCGLEPAVRAARFEAALSLLHTQMWGEAGFREEHWLLVLDANYHGPMPDPFTEA